MKRNGKLIGYSVLIITFLSMAVFFSSSCISQKRLDQELANRIEQAQKEAAEAEAARQKELEEQALLAKKERERVVLVKTLPVFSSDRIAENQTAEPKIRLSQGDTVLLTETGTLYSLIEIEGKNISGYVWNEGIGKKLEGELLDVKVIVIDAGGQQNGNSEMEMIGPEADVTGERMGVGATGVSTGCAEYEVTLAVALKLEQELGKRDGNYIVLQVRREHNVDISYAERACLANQVEADALIQLYGNVSEDSEVHGAYAYCISDSNSYGGGERYEESKRLAESLLDGYTHAAEEISRNSVEESDEYTELNWCRVPSVILKLGYFSNSGDDTSMNDPFGQDGMAKGMADGLDEYFQFHASAPEE